MRYGTMAVMAALVLSACSGTGAQKSTWDDIDYSRIARDNQARENDPVYVQPTVAGCVDDDLYNCSKNNR